MREIPLFLFVLCISEILMSLYEGKSNIKGNSFLNSREVMSRTLETTQSTRSIDFRVEEQDMLIRSVKPLHEKARSHIVALPKTNALQTLGISALRTRFVTLRLLFHWSFNEGDGILMRKRTPVCI